MKTDSRLALRHLEIRIDVDVDAFIESKGEQADGPSFPVGRRQKEKKGEKGRPGITFTACGASGD